MNLISRIKEILKTGDSDALLAFVKEFPQVLKEKDESNTSSLLIIAYQSRKETLAEIAKLTSAFTFYEAIIYGQQQDVESQLKDHPQLLNSYSSDGFTPVALACFFDQEVIAKFLLQQGADPNTNANNPSKVNALHAAVAKNNIKLCKLLISNGADVNIPQMQNVTPLHSAVHRGNFEMVKLLLDSGADIYLTMDNGDTAMSIAIREGHNKIKEYLEAV